MTKTQQELEDEPFWLWWDENIMVCSHDYRSKKTGIVISSNEFKDCWIKSRQQSDERIEQMQDDLESLEELLGKEFFNMKESKLLLEIRKRNNL